MKKSILLMTLLSFGATIGALNEEGAVKVFNMSPISIPKLSGEIKINNYFSETTLSREDVKLIKELFDTSSLSNIKNKKLKAVYSYLKGLGKEFGNINYGDLRKAREKMYPMSFSEKVLFGAFVCAPIAFLSTLGYLAYSFAK